MDIYNPRTADTLCRPVMALHKDAVRLDVLDNLRTRLFNYVPGPEPLSLWYIDSRLDA